MESEDKYTRLLKKAQEINLDQEEIPEDEKENKINKKTIIKKKDDDLDEVPKMLKKKKILKKADNRLRAVKRKQKKNCAEFLVKIICFQYFLVFWKKKAIAMKYSTTGYNKKRVAFKKFYAKIRDIYYKKKIESDAEIFEIFLNLPERPGVIHDKNFNKLKFVNNEVLIEKYENLIEEMSIKNVGLKIKKILVESMKLNDNNSNNNDKNNVINIESNKKNEISLNEDDLKDSNYKEIKLKRAKKEINKKLVQPESLPKKNDNEIDEKIEQNKNEIKDEKNDEIKKEKKDEKIEQNKNEIKDEKKDEIKKEKKDEKKDEKIEQNKNEIKDEKKEDLNEVDIMENKLKKVFKQTFGS